MKHLTASFIVLFALHLCSCQKESLTARKKIPDASLFGDWKLAGNYISSGGPQYFVPAKVSSKATFNTDGRLTGTSFPTYNRYTFVDSATIKLTGAGTDYTTYLYK